MTLRPAKGADAPAMADILNQLIRIGGTTSYVSQVSATALDRMVLARRLRLSAHVAEDGARLIGWQAVTRHPDLPEGWGDIGTYVRPGLQRRGTGSSLFEASLKAAQTGGLQTLHALVRDDNAAALSFYRRHGFRPMAAAEQEQVAAAPDLVLPTGGSVARHSLILSL